MNSKLKKNNFTYRKLKLSDYNKFNKLFYSSFKKKISYDFFKWRYFSNKSSFCYGAFYSSELIANVGMVCIRLNKHLNEKTYSRHSSMVLKEYRGLGIFSDLLKNLKKKFLGEINLVVMWPNKNNFANFNLGKSKIIKKKYYLYKTSSHNILSKKTESFPISELVKLKNFIKSNNNLFVKNFPYFYRRYLIYNKHEYLINRYKSRTFTSFFILKKNKDSTGSNYVILDHFGSSEISSKHLSYLIKEKNKLIFLSKKKIYKSNHKLINYINLKIGFLKKINIKEKSKFLINKEIFLGDTDSFITI